MLPRMYVRMSDITAKPLTSNALTLVPRVLAMASLASNFSFRLEHASMPAVPFERSVSIG